MDTQSGKDSSQVLLPVVDKTTGHSVSQRHRRESERLRRFMADEPGNILSSGSQRLTEPLAMTERARTGRYQDRRLHARQEGRALTWRAIILGLALVIFVAIFTPYNDYVLQNSPFIGNHFPSGIVTLMAALILLVNPAIMAIYRWTGRGRPFSPGEMTVIMTMMLVGAAIPSSGLMRYLEPMMVVPYWLVRNFPWFARNANPMDHSPTVISLMPRWLVPSTDPSSPIVTNYWLGIDPVRGGHVPILPFLLPALFWSILIAAILGGALFLAAIFRKQWVHHERLSYPLATIPLELMAAPEEGHWYNALWRNPVLWAGATIPFLVYLLAGLHSYFPAVPFVNLQYDVRQAFTDRPWDVMPTYITQAQLYFAAVGICFFIPSEVAFSLWLFVFANGALRVFFARSSFNVGLQENTRAMGTYVAYFAGLLWLARGHLKYVLLSAWKKSPRAEDEPITYRTMVVGWLGCMTVAWIWLMAVGMNWLMALLLLGIGTMLVTLMARIVTETGLFWVGPVFWPNAIFSTLLGKGIVGMRSFFWTEVTSRIFFADLRETLMPFAANALRMGQEIKSSPPGAPAGSAGDRGKWFRWLCISLFVSALASGAANHYISYTHGRTTMDGWASDTVPHEGLNETYAFQNSTPDTSFGESWAHFGVGAVMALALMVGRVMWASWPFHPIGLVLMSSGPMKVLWFSIFIGWAAKRLLLRYGGAGAFRRARPFFIGLIMGEIVSAGMWMFLGLLTGGAVKYTLLPG